MSQVEDSVFRCSGKRKCTASLNAVGFVFFVNKHSKTKWDETTVQKPDAQRSFCSLIVKDATFSTQTGTCALFFAAQGGFVEIVKELLSHGAPVDLSSYVSDVVARGGGGADLQSRSGSCVGKVAVQRIEAFLLKG